MNKSLIIKINQCSEQVVGPVRKLYGLLPPKSLVQLLDTDDLAANPRSAKKGSVTADIEDSLKTSPELFPAKTKGILLASSSYKVLERDRYQLSFVEPETEGILDGGHNALSAGRYILREAGLSDRDLNRVKDWDDFRNAWIENRTAIGEIVDLLDFEMPVEVQVPANMHDEGVLETFRSSLLEIGAARNNNVQLSEETKANKKGFYDVFKEHLPASLANDVEWKTNDGGRIKLRDIIALCWIGLSKMELPDGRRFNTRRRRLRLQAAQQGGKERHADRRRVPGTLRHALRADAQRLQQVGRQLREDFCGQDLRPRQGRREEPQVPALEAEHAVLPEAHRLHVPGWVHRAAAVRPPRALESRQGRLAGVEDQPASVLEQVLRRHHEELPARVRDGDLGSAEGREKHKRVRICGKLSFCNL